MNCSSPKEISDYLRDRAHRREERYAWWIDRVGEAGAVLVICALVFAAVR